jgi:hypothetical protein
MRTIGVLLGASLAFAVAATGASAQTKDDAALRKRCAHLVKMKLKIQDTGNVRDLAGVSGAVQMVDQCVANGGLTSGVAASAGGSARAAGAMEVDSEIDAV